VFALGTNLAECGSKKSFEIAKARNRLNLPRSKPLCWWSAADVGLDCKQLRDPLQRLLRQRRPGVDTHIVNLAAGVTPACNLDQTRRGDLGIAFIKAFEASVAVYRDNPSTPASPGAPTNSKSE
jgi:hypothetical protein